MNSTRQACAIVLFTLVLSGCNGREVIGPAPTPPSQIPPPLPVPAVSGDLTLGSIRPEAGATVLVRPCADASTRFCADKLELSVEIVVDQDLDGVSLTVKFDGCGFASSPTFSLASHRPAVINLSRVDLSDDGPNHDGVGAALYCELPAMTRRVIVSLWRTGQARVPLLTREFAREYTFARP